MTDKITKIDDENIEIEKTTISTQTYTKNQLLRNKADLQVQKDSIAEQEAGIDSLLAEFEK